MLNATTILRQLDEVAPPRQASCGAWLLTRELVASDVCLSGRLSVVGSLIVLALRSFLLAPGFERLHA